MQQISIKYNIKIKLHTSFSKAYELHHLTIPHFPRKEPIKKSLLEDLPSQMTTSQGPIIPPLHKPCLSHVLKLISGQLGLYTCGKFHSQKYIIYLIDEFLGVFLNHRPIESRRVYSSEVP